MQRLTDILQGAEDIASCLFKTKAKLENSLAETNDELMNEKIIHSDVKRINREFEAEFKVCENIFRLKNLKKRYLLFWFIVIRLHNKVCT